MSEQARKRVALLEALAFGDGEQTPEVRLRAVEALQLEPSLEPDEPFTDLTDEEAVLFLDLDLADHIDSLVGWHPAPTEPLIDPAESRRRLPVTAEVIRWGVERRARELADADRIDAEVRERAEQLAQRYYVDRGVDRFEALLADDVAGTMDEPTALATEPQRGAQGLPPGLVREDVERPWRRDGRRQSRW